MTGTLNLASDRRAAGTRLWRGGETYAALKRLDQRLEAAVVAAQQNYENPGEDPFRGLYISPEDVQRLLNRNPGEQLLFPGGNGAHGHLVSTTIPDSPLAWLAHQYRLTAFELDTLLICLAPEIDLRYERLYAYLQDDISRKRPSIDLVLNLLCSTAEEKLAYRNRLTPTSPLVAQHLVSLQADPSEPQGSALGMQLKLDEQIIRMLLEHPGPDSRLSGFCTLQMPDHALSEADLQEPNLRAVMELIARAHHMQSGITVYFQGPEGTGKRLSGEILASKLGLPILAVNWTRAMASGLPADHFVSLVRRECLAQGAVAYIDHLPGQSAERSETQDGGLAALLNTPAIVAILAGAEPWQNESGDLIEIIPVPFTLPDYQRRRSAWQATAQTAGFLLEDEELDALAGRFQLSYEQIARAVVHARAAARLRFARQAGERETQESPHVPNHDELFAGARAQSGQALHNLAHKIEPVYHWEDIVLPEDSHAQLLEICQRIIHGEKVLGAWGFGEKLSLGKGVNALFSGPSGTGKTMAAEIIAKALGLDLFKIDLAGVVSKYIGETEKNLERIFAAAENANAILFFDEADALFGRRSEVRDAHDRYANIEIAYLLQQMERYAGLTILATNLRQNLDEAFLRRLAFTVHFPFPDETSRRLIWAGIWPPETPLAADLDLDFLANRFKLSGGNIKNIALAAAFQAAASGEDVSMAHVLHAIRREYQKLGKPLSAAELGSHASGADKR